jgi:hypothetical protein
VKNFGGTRNVLAVAVFFLPTVVLSWVFAPLLIKEQHSHHGGICLLSLWLLTALAAAGVTAVAGVGLGQPKVAVGPLAAAGAPLRGRRRGPVERPQGPAR